METRGRKAERETGFSARQLAVVFLTAVAVCAVFFSLGFLVGFNERSSKAAPVSEQVPTRGIIPPTVNPPPTRASATTPSTATGQEQVSTETVAEPGPVNPAASSVPAGVEGNFPSPSVATGSGAAAAGQEVSTGFTIQVAATTTKKDAEAVVGRLKARGYPVFLVTPEYAHADDNLFRVQVGPYASRDEAEQARQKLAREGFKQPFIKH